MERKSTVSVLWGRKEAGSLAQEPVRQLVRARVLDLASEQGVHATKLLADLGADVLRVEPPGGDSLRRRGPFVLDKPDTEGSLSSWYSNVNKRGITLALETPLGQDLFHRLVATTDILVETFPVGFLDSLGLGYASLREDNPGLIMVSITPFGQNGPYQVYHGSDLVAAAMGGMAYLNGEPTGPPLRPFGEVAYHLAGYFGAIGALLALSHRHLSQQGQHIDVSLQACVAASLDHALVRYFAADETAQRQGALNRDGGHCILRCRDGYILVSLFYQWEVLVGWLDSEGMAADLIEPQWRDPEVRRRHLPHLIEVVGKWTSQHTVAELEAEGQLRRLPWAAVNTLEQVATHPQLQDRGYFQPGEAQEQGPPSPYLSAPWMWGGIPRRPPRGAPRLGEHNQEVYQKELGLAPEELEDLRKRGVI